MAYGGDMAQFTEMESVVPDLNPAEANGGLYSTGYVNTQIQEPFQEG